MGKVKMVAYKILKCIAKPNALSKQDIIFNYMHSFRKLGGGWVALGARCGSGVGG